MITCAPASRSTPAITCPKPPIAPDPVTSAIFPTNERALARFSLAVWPVGGRYRMLLALAQRDLGMDRVVEILEPARVRATAIVKQGQRDGVFHSPSPPEVLSPPRMKRRRLVVAVCLAALPGGGVAVDRIDATVGLPLVGEVTVGAAVSAAAGNRTAFTDIRAGQGELFPHSRRCWKRRSQTRPAAGRSAGTAPERGHIHAGRDDADFTGHSVAGRASSSLTV
ncbi:hypothetical protein [Streptomyces sp. Amel2xE9]|uniref:hypothetical protein n=1 Tax=Streptomyces sp. Amel2xE9 TaxID=1157634 RepID=UPI003B638AA9